MNVSRIRTSSLRVILVAILIVSCVFLLTPPAYAGGGGGGGEGESSSGGFLGGIVSGISNGISAVGDAIGGLFGGGGGGSNSGSNHGNEDRWEGGEGGDWHNNNNTPNSIDFSLRSSDAALAGGTAVITGTIKVNAQRTQNTFFGNEGGGPDDWGGGANSWGGGSGANSDAGSNSGASGGSTGPSGDGSVDGGLGEFGGPGGDPTAGQGDTDAGMAGDCSGVCGASTSTIDTSLAANTYLAQNDHSFTNLPTANLPAPGDNDNEQLISKIELDHGCDGSFETDKDFSVSYETPTEIGSQFISFTVTFEDTPAGSHCYMITLDHLDRVNESNEENNESDLIPISLGSSDDPVTPLPDVTPVVSCPVYAPPLCAPGERVLVGEPDENGCTGAPYCAPGIVRDDAGPADITFETKVYARGTSADNGPVVKILKYDWTEEDTLYLDDDDILYFRWDASSYSQCLIDINPVHYGFTTPTTGDTERDEIEVRTLQTSYGVNCTKNGQTFRKDVVIFF